MISKAKDKAAADRKALTTAICPHVLGVLVVSPVKQNLPNSHTWGSA